MPRNKGVDWNTGSGTITQEQARLAVLMDIRDELQHLNRLLNCQTVAKAARAIIRAERRMARHLPLKP